LASIQPLNSLVVILHQLFEHFFITNKRPFLILASGFEKTVGFVNNILSSKEIIELDFFS